MMAVAQWRLCFFLLGMEQILSITASVWLKSIRQSFQLGQPLIKMSALLP